MQFINTNKISSGYFVQNKNYLPIHKRKIVTPTPRLVSPKQIERGRMSVA